MSNKSSERTYLCYMLISKNQPRKPPKIYIGCTNNILGRIKQHNGQRSGGAKYTKKYRPWTISTLVGPFTQSEALKFEWAWQHPWRTRHLKKERQMKLIRKTRSYTNFLKTAHYLKDSPYWSKLDTKIYINRTSPRLVSLSNTFFRNYYGEQNQ